MNDFKIGNVTNNPIYCIIPPHMLKSMIQHGDQKLREWALKTMTATEQFRGRRVAVGALSTISVSAGEKRRTIYDGRNGYDLPGMLVRGECDPASDDQAVNEAFNVTGTTYDFFKEIYGRNSIDDKGMRMESTVHYSKDYGNASWDGQQMIYGDGDGNIFSRFTKAIDVVAHEITHGVTENEAKLVYWEQPGALNESFSDVLGSMVKQWALGQKADQADWLIGEGLFMPGFKGSALRSMKDPGFAYDHPKLGKDPQPKHIDGFVDTNDDNGGVHINSGIPNHAFYVTAIEIGGYAWEKAGLIWYVALRDRLQRKSNFQDAANITFMVAGDLFGCGSIEQEAVCKGWSEVGIEAAAVKARGIGAAEAGTATR